ncbi:MAG: HlyD family efflux transporter periplasmic adaptor subunit [Xanthomonadales bacterium]|nr:HlyD family efflux transporter periplasmic adaptor subunit [Gammaproteobacteria bacterium]MBT8052283.1 HlyD family efflux transporter periplasmic adaptor subunit [Gammaproteobacteria bacterium]NND56896.1 HlyD family efflux transporter periplasmic adaptor subunit [Xanthomonadales bacterium]NNK51507.1 HlyD family efflux transporter periplasmic adaptor subunit [Xanthomonadales bacterium]
MNMTKRMAWSGLALLALAMSACDSAETTYMVGTLERDRIDIVAESNEPITAIRVADGQAVDAGDPILEQDPSRAEARLAQYRAQRNQAAARLAELQRGPRKESIREARARLEASRLQEENALAVFNRTREVFDKKLASKDTLDRDETAWRTAAAQVKAESEVLGRLLNGTTVEELDQAVAALEAGDAQVRQAQLDLDRTRLHAPVAGLVDKVLYRIGERPAPGSTIAVVLDGSRTFARVYVPEQLRTRVTPGTAISVRVDGESTAFSGRVRWVSSDASFTPYFALTEHDRSRLSYLAEIDVPDAAGLPSGVPLQADFPGE